MPPLGPQRHGYFVLFRLDTEASVRQLDDDEASRAAALIPRNWYFGLILSNGGAQLKNANGRELLNFKFCLVGEGPPDPASNSIPIAPAPQLRDDRPPLQLHAPLPWSNLYIHTLVRAGGVVTRIHPGPAVFEPVLSEEQQTWVYTCHFMDVVKDDEATADSEPVSVPDGPADDDASIGLESSAATVSFDIQSIEDMYDKVRVHVEIWLDSSSCPGPLAIPSTWTETMMRLKGIWKDWYDRRVEEVKTMGARKAGEWVQTIGDADKSQDALSPSGRQVDESEDPAAPHVAEHGRRPQLGPQVISDVLDDQNLPATPIIPTTTNQYLDSHLNSQAESDLDRTVPPESQPTVTTPGTNVKRADVQPGAPPAARERSASTASLRASRKTFRTVVKLPGKFARRVLSSLRSAMGTPKTRRSPALGAGQRSSEN